MKLSKLYRDDPIDSLDAETREYVDGVFLGNIGNLNIANPKLLVVFSGGNAVGKTALAERIGRELDGLVLENDAIKRILKQHDITIDRDKLSQLTWNYTMELYTRLDAITNNGLVVRDGVIDWYYDRILPVFIERGYRIFIIAYDLSHQKSIELIKARGDTPTANESRLYTLLEDHAVHQRRFRSLYTPDIILEDETVFDHDTVVDLLKRRLTELK